ncbi:HAD-IIA family hydrolase [Halarchaeum sp. P4]|uniref:HAD-IIA family hydrolase n=1 Tax=Halarchaeum sp. P4 TaxID=3421639 RepID=UPI003EB8CDFE
MPVLDPRAAVVDLDGTLLSGDSLLPGAREAMTTIRGRVEAVCFVTNNPTVPPEAYAARLREWGIEASPEEVVTAGVATVTYLREHHAEDRIFPIAGADVVAQLRDADLSLVDDPEPSECVVVGYDPAFSYNDMRAALRAFAGDGETGFVGTDPDRTIPTPDGPVPGSGALINAVAGVVDRDPDAVLGKPSAETADIVLNRLGVPAETVVLVGDNPATDVAFGERAGMTTVRVETGLGTDGGDGAPDADYVVSDVGGVAGLFRDA